MITLEYNTVYPIEYAHGFVVLCFVVVTLSIMIDSLPISFRVASPALRQSYDCPNAGEVILKDMGKIIHYLTMTIYCKIHNSWDVLYRVVIKLENLMYLDYKYSDIFRLPVAELVLFSDWAELYFCSLWICIFAQQIMGSFHYLFLSCNCNSLVIWFCLHGIFSHGMCKIWLRSCHK